MPVILIALENLIRINQSLLENFQQTLMEFFSSNLGLYFSTAITTLLEL